MATPLGQPSSPEARVDVVVAQVRPFDEANLRVKLEQFFEENIGNIGLKVGVLQDTLKSYIGGRAAANALGELPPDRKSLELAVKEFNDSLSGFLAKLRVRFSPTQQEPISQVLEVSEELGAGHLSDKILQSLSRTRPDELMEEYIAALRTPHLQLMGKADIPDLPAPAGREPIVIKTELVDHFVAAAKEAHGVSVQQLRASLLAKEQEVERTERAANAVKRVPKKADEAAASFLINPLDRQTYINEERALFIMCGGVIRDLTGKRFGPQNTGEVEALLAEGFSISDTLRTRIQEADDLMAVYSVQRASAFVEGKIAEITVGRQEALAVCARDYVQWLGDKLRQVFAVPAGTDPEEAAIYEEAVESVVKKVSQTMSGHATEHYAEMLGRLVPLLPSAVLPLLASRVHQTATSLSATAGALQSSASILNTAIEGLSSDAFLARLATEVTRAVGSRLAPPAPLPLLRPTPSAPTPVSLDIEADDVVKALLKRLPRVLAAMQDPKEAANTLTRALVAAGMDHMDAEQLSQNLLSYPLRGISAPEPGRRVIVKLGQYELSANPKTQPTLPTPRAPRQSRRPISRWVKAAGVLTIAGGLASTPYLIGGRDLTEDVEDLKALPAQVWAALPALPKRSADPQVVPLEAPVEPVARTPWVSLESASYPTFDNPTTQWVADLSAATGVDASQGAIAIQCIGGKNQASATQPAQVHSFPMGSDAVSPEGGIKWLVDGCHVDDQESFTVGACVADVCAAKGDGFLAVALTPEQN